MLLNRHEDLEFEFLFLLKIEAESLLNKDSNVDFNKLILSREIAYLTIN